MIREIISDVLLILNPKGPPQNPKDQSPSDCYSYKRDAVVRGAGRRWAPSNSWLFQGFQHLMLGQPFVHTEKHLLSNPAGSDCSLMHFSMCPVAPGSPFQRSEPVKGMPTLCSFEPVGDKWHEVVFEEHLGMWREGGEAS